MAKPRRRKVGMRKRRHADWVYRPNVYVISTRGTGVGSDGLGTYDFAVPAHNTGPLAAQSHILYDSHNYFADLTRGGQAPGAMTIAQQGVLPRAARAEGRKACIRAFQATIYAEPSIWAIGNVWALGIRLGVFEQDISGVFSLDADYSMWSTPATIPGMPPAHWANFPRNNVKEWRFWKIFSDNQSISVLRLSWRGRKFLEPQECFGLYTELPVTSVNMRLQYWCRTLVEDEG